MYISTDVLMSSPPRPARLDPYSMSSSPSLPSLNEIFANSQKPPLQSGSTATPVPDHARATFTTAASILRDAPEIDIETEQITKSPSRKPKTGRVQKKRSPVPNHANIPVDSPILIESSPDEKPWQKYQSRKQAQRVEQPTTSKTRVTRPTTKIRAKGKTETVSRHFTTKENPANQAREKLNKGKGVDRAGGRIEDGIGDRIGDRHTGSGPSCSEPALRRRDDWTSPPVDNPILIGSQSDNRELQSSGDEIRSKDVFNTLLDQYGCDAGSSFTATEQPQVDILKKRKLIELVSTSNDGEQRSREPSPAKTVTAKKKTRTITELATAPYLLPAVPEIDLSGPDTKDSLLNYFDSDGAVKALVEHQTAVMSYKKDKAEEKKAPAKPKRKKKSGTANNPILLSPSSALKQSSNQDFVFGTSSQLVREESPSTLRDLQRAIQASNQADSDPAADSDSRGLWRAGARDMDGDLMNTDDVELVEELPSLPHRGEQAKPPEEEFVDIDDILKSSELDDLKAAAAPRPNSQTFQPETAPGAQPLENEDQPSVEPQPAVGRTNDTRPDYETLTDAQLARQIASYGFKPVKKRQAMIALLDQCWSSKSLGAASSHSRPMSTSSATHAPKKKEQTVTAEPEKDPKRRGRPRKNSTNGSSSTAKTAAPKAASSKAKASKVAASKATSSTAASPKRSRGRAKAKSAKSVEIADSDLDEPISSSSSRASSPEMDQVFSSPPPVDLSLSEEADMSLAAASPTDRQAELFRHITKAVTSAPRSQDPARPSWHEKMLLYDPIVLEDLAAWLNAGALGRTGHDGEVSPQDVKVWCESKSVVCLWRQNLRGKERKRY
ncbi:hypothetical protein GGR52DRAFT_581100 [Hypoxylon sp. FL1284]|nr:hypothetical protein GGR52DRAFT_581100 [Hypoxylon sp. FL1284]